MSKYPMTKLKHISSYISFHIALYQIKASGLATTLTKLQADLEAKYAKTSAAIVAWLGEVNAKFEAAVKEWETYPQVGGGVGVVGWWGRQW